MNDSVIIDYIRQRMNELGISNYTYEFVSFNLANNTTINVPDDGCFYYQYWWGVNVFPTGGTIVIEQLEARLSGNYEAWNEIGVLEFYGFFTISVSGFAGLRPAYPVQFIKVYS